MKLTRSALVSKFNDELPFKNRIQNLITCFVLLIKCKIIHMYAFFTKHCMNCLLYLYVNLIQRNTFQDKMTLGRQ